MEDTIIKNNFGKVFGSGVRGCAFVFFLIGAFLIIGDAGKSALISVLIGLIIIFFSCMIMFLINGIHIDTKNKRIRTYYKYLFFNYQNDWKSIEEFKFVTILNFNMSSSTFSRSNRANTITEKQHQIHLLNENHTKRKLIHSFTDKENAIEFSKMIAEKLGIETIQYNPPATRRKGGRR